VLSLGLLGLTSPAAPGASAAPAGSAAGAPVSTADPITSTGSATDLVRAPSRLGGALRRTTVVRGWAPGTERMTTSAPTRSYQFRVTATGPAGRQVLVQRARAGRWITVAVARTGSGPGHAVRIRVVVPRGSTAWRLLLPRTPSHSGLATGAKRFVVGAPARLPIPMPTGPGQSVAYASHFRYLVPERSTDPLVAARWDRCEPIRVTGDFTRVTAAGLTAAGERARWRDVLAKAAAASGYTLLWVDSAPGRGTITGDGNITGIRRQTGAYAPGAAHADIVVTYGSATDPGAYHAPTLGGGVLGYGGPRWRQFSSPTRNRAFAAQVILDYADIKALGLGPGSLTDLYLHEFGHAMGLGHMADPTQIMNATLVEQPLINYRRGDRTGLRQLAAQPCTKP
jgi:hypothetical protein